MTIKVCKEKTMDGIERIGKVVSKTIQVLILALIPFGVYCIFINNPLGSALGLTFGFIGTFIFVPMFRGMYDDDVYTTILHDINNSLKLFTWNEDC